MLMDVSGYGLSLRDGSDTLIHTFEGRVFLLLT